MANIDDEIEQGRARLNGYGLALPLERSTKFDPSEFASRITWLGKKLIEILAANSKH
jgi:hypothetical protein